MSGLQVTTWSLDLAEGIKFVHGLVPKIIHRDIKPDNVLLDVHLRCKLGDFGLSKTLGSELVKSKRDHGHLETQRNLTGGFKLRVEHEGFMMTGHTGTYCYMAPEVSIEALDADGMCAYDESCDIFSYGMVINFMCTGRRPFHWLRCLQAKEKLQKGARPDMEALSRHYPEWLVNLLTKCLFHNPHDRPTAAEVVDFVTLNTPAAKQGIVELLAALPRSLSARRLTANSPDGDSRTVSPDMRVASPVGAAKRRHSIH